MNKYLNKNKYNVDILYNKIVFLSRNKLFYTKLNLKDTFQNRINLIFIHISFLFVKIKHNNTNISFNAFYQNVFDVIFKKIELNMRELGHGDVTVNKNMKFLVKVFYNVLLNCEKYSNKSFDEKNIFLLKYLITNSDKKGVKYKDLVNYFDNYQAFCLDLSPDKVLKGELNFIYK